MVSTSCSGLVAGVVVVLMTAVVMTAHAQGQVLDSVEKAYIKKHGAKSYRDNLKEMNKGRRQDIKLYNTQNKKDKKEVRKAMQQNNAKKLHPGKAILIKGTNFLSKTKQL